MLAIAYCDPRAREVADRPQIASPAGDVLDFSELRSVVEIVVGFRPGIDTLVLPRGKVLSIRLEGGDVVIDCGVTGIIVLQGVPMTDFLGPNATLAA